LADDVMALTTGSLVRLDTAFHLLICILQNSSKCITKHLQAGNLKLRQTVGAVVPLLRDHPLVLRKRGGLSWGGQ